MMISIEPGRGSLVAHGCRPIYRMIVVLAVLLCCGGPVFAQAQPAPDPLPPLSEIKDAIRKHFADLRNWEENDLLSQEDIKPVFEVVEKTGWTIPEKLRKELLDRVLANNDELVQKLRTRAGTKFMRQCSQYPDAYDRLDRLREMPYGYRRIQELIDAPGGYKLIEYLTDTKAGKNLGTQIARGKNGKDFNEPTREIYKSDQLIKAIGEEYQAEVKRRKAGAQIPAPVPPNPPSSGGAPGTS